MNESTGPNGSTASPKFALGRVLMTRGVNALVEQKRLLVQVPRAPCWQLWRRAKQQRAHLLRCAPTTVVMLGNCCGNILARRQPSLTAIGSPVRPAGPEPEPRNESVLQ